MPNATVSGRTHRVSLKHCPGGWVDLKQLTYDQMLERRDNATRMYLEQTQKEEDSKVNLQVANRWAVTFDFRNCIVDHNLEDDKGNKLDFNNSLTLTVLDPKVGAEIEQAIDELNQDTEGEMEAFFSPATSSSTESSDTTESSAE